MNILSKEQVLKLHASLIKATGGIDGIRDEGMLDLALNNPFQLFDGKELYKHSGRGGTALFWIGKKPCNVVRKQKTWRACYVSFSCIEWI